MAEVETRPAEAGQRIETQLVERALVALPPTGRSRMSRRCIDGRVQRDQIFRRTNDLHAGHPVAGIHGIGNGPLNPALGHTQLPAPLGRHRIGSDDRPTQQPVELSGREPTRLGQHHSLDPLAQLGRWEQPRTVGDQGGALLVDAPIPQRRERGGELGGQVVRSYEVVLRAGRADRHRQRELVARRFDRAMDVGALRIRRRCAVLVLGTLGQDGRGGDPASGSEPGQPLPRLHQNHHITRRGR